LQLDVTVKTYRYLDEEEQAAVDTSKAKRPPQH
jgi:Tfp pilus assembly protein PilO